MGLKGLNGFGWVGFSVLDGGIGLNWIGLGNWMDGLDCMDGIGLDGFD